MEVEAVGASVAIFTKAHGNKKPYEVISSDIHKCPSCNNKVAAAFADQPFWRHFHDEPVPKIDYAVWEK